MLKNLHSRRKWGRDVVKGIAISAMLLMLGGCAASKTSEQILRQPNPATIDSYTLASLRINVSFFDPSFAIKKKYQLFETYDIERRAQLWDEYLHNAALYLFDVRDQKGTTLRYFCLRGNPQRAGKAMFLQLESIEAAGLDLLDPNRQLYTQKVSSHEDLLSVGGLAFENMAQFSGEDSRKFIGADIVYLGRSTRVVPYREIKAAVNTLIARELGVTAAP
jgi:hypothetical protein